MSLKLSTPFSAVDGSQKFTLGSTTPDHQGREFIYLQGSDSVASYDVVVYNSAYLATKVAAGNRGQLAIAQGAVVGNNFGWFQIKGLGTVEANGAVAASTPLYLTTGSGNVDDAIGAGNLIIGMLTDTTGTAGAGQMHAMLSYPFVGSITAA